MSHPIKTIAEVLAKVNDLPSLPTVAARINEETDKESLTSKSLAGIISQDVSLVTRVLKLANSAYYGMSRQVDTIDHAVTILGINTIKSLAMALSISGIFHDHHSDEIDMKGLWVHSLGCGVIARSLVAHSDQDLAEKAFLCGIIHDIGLIAIATIVPIEFAHTKELMNDFGVPQCEAEKQILGFSHAEMGGKMAEGWKFPEDYQEAIALHHCGKTNGSDHNSKILCNSVYLANKICKIKKLGVSVNPNYSKVSQSSLELVGINKDQMVRSTENAEADLHQLLMV
ncbi:MAG: HDOD domain-containing protein [Proteobacteria bacterium]|nr:HDOD domain-containing protein [Pseudomonadota bacterium]MBU1688432.1 HDOD domain-containing protein [Pseudomonadota bacterium]